MNEQSCLKTEKLHFRGTSRDENSQNQNHYYTISRFWISTITSFSLPPLQSSALTSGCCIHRHFTIYNIYIYTNTRNDGKKINHITIHMTLWWRHGSEHLYRFFVPFSTSFYLHCWQIAITTVSAGISFFDIFLNCFLFLIELKVYWAKQNLIFTMIKMIFIWHIYIHISIFLLITFYPRLDLEKYKW